MTKSTWMKPELIIMIRNKPEEFVLGGCKSQVIDSGPHTDIGEFGYNCMGSSSQPDVSTTPCQGAASS